MRDKRVGEGNGNSHHEGDDRAKCQEERLRVDSRDVVPSHAKPTEVDEGGEDYQPDQLHDDHGLQGVVDEVTIKQFHFSRVSLNVLSMRSCSSSVIVSRCDTEW